MPQQPAVYSKLSVAENLRAVRAAGEGRRPRRGRRRGCSSRPAWRDRAGDELGHAVGRQPPAGEHRRRPARRPARAAARRAVVVAGPAPARAPVGVRRRRWPRAGTAVVFSTHNVGEAERYADRVLVLADGELLFTGTPARARGARSAATRGTSRPRSCASCTSAGTEPPMRWLLLKDLQILRRSPLLVGAARRLPGLIALLIGLALSRGPGQAEGRVRQRGARRADAASRSAASSSTRRSTPNELFESVDPVPVDTRAEAHRRRSRRRGRSARSSSRPTPRSKLQDAINLGGGDAADASRCSTTPRTRSRRSSSSRRSSRAWPTPTRRSPTSSRSSRRSYLRILLDGGHVLDLLGQNFDILGLQQLQGDPRARSRTLPPGSPQARDAASRSSTSRSSPIDNLDLSDDGAGLGRPAAEGQAHGDRGAGARRSTRSPWPSR